MNTCSEDFMKKTKLVSIIFPSRSRLDLVKKLLISIEEKTKDKSAIEVISINHYSIHNKKSEIDDISKRVAETSENSKVRIGLRMTDKWDTIYNIMKLNRNKYLMF